MILKTNVFFHALNLKSLRVEGFTRRRKTALFVCVYILLLLWVISHYYSLCIGTHQTSVIIRKYSICQFIVKSWQWQMRVLLSGARQQLRIFISEFACTVFLHSWRVGGQWLKRRKRICVFNRFKSVLPLPYNGK